MCLRYRVRLAVNYNRLSSHPGMALHLMGHGALIRSNYSAASLKNLLSGPVVPLQIDFYYGSKLLLKDCNYFLWHRTTPFINRLVHVAEKGHLPMLLSDGR